MEFKEVQKLVYDEYIKNEYEYMWNLEDLKLFIKTNFHLADDYFNGEQLKQLLSIADIAEVGLVNTEVSELLEDIRKDKGLKRQANECADIVIRVMNYCTRKGIDLESSIRLKHIFNMSREKLHGKLV